jgi:hypothetical protein
VSFQEASLISGLRGDLFSKTLIMSTLASFLVRDIFEKMGLFLWDLKWEIARDGEDLVFVDTIDTDSVRVTVNISHNGKSYFIHFNKQSMRDYYRIMHPEWIRAVNEAKARASHTGRPFVEILKEGQEQGKYPATPEVERTFLDIQRDKFKLIMNYIMDPQTDFKADVEEIALREIEFYKSKGKIAEFEAINAVD